MAEQARQGLEKENPRDVRGVHEDMHPPDGYRSWIVVGASGSLLFRHTVKAELVNRQTVLSLYSLLDQVDPTRPRLTVM